VSPTSGVAPIEVLLVEDSPDDAALTVRALQQAKIRNRVHVATDGAAALDFLYRRGRHADAPAPDLILLDLNLPKVDGRQVLETIKGDERLRGIPVVVVEFLSAVTAIERFWLEIVRLP